MGILICKKCIEILLSGRENPGYPDLSHGGLSFKKAKLNEKKNQQLGIGLESE
jgi:hypothetical protein